MIHRPGKLLSHFWSPQSGPYVLLILLFIMVFVVSPLLYTRIVMPVILQTASWLLILAGAFNVSSRTSIRLLALTVALLSIALRWMGLSFSGKTIEEVDIFLSLGMLSIFALLMIQSFLVTGRAWAHRIAAAIAVYLLLGLIWARLYEFVELLAQGAFRVPAGEHLNSANLVYFSFVRLSTLGVRGLRVYSCRSAQFGGPRGDYGSTAYGDPDFPYGLRKVGKSGGKATQVRTDA